MHSFHPAKNWNFRINSELLELRNLVECAIRRHESRGLHDTRPPEDQVVRRY